MATEQSGPVRAHKAAADLSAKKNHFVGAPNAAGEVNVVGAGARSYGTLVDGAAAGKTVTIRVGERGLVVTGAAVTAGAEITPDAAGKAVAATTGNYVGGIALESAGAAGVVIAYERTLYKI